MPIPKHLRHFYRGAAYEAFRRALLDRAGNACEQCRAPHRQRVFRVQPELTEFAGWWWSELDGVGHNGNGYRQEHLTLEVMVEFFGARFRPVRIIVGPAHLNHTPGDLRLKVARALCQYDHLIYDKEHHKDTRITRKDGARGLLQLPEAS